MYSGCNSAERSSLWILLRDPYYGWLRQCVTWLAGTQACRQLNEDTGTAR